MLETGCKNPLLNTFIELDVKIYSDDFQKIFSSRTEEIDSSFKLKIFVSNL